MTLISKTSLIVLPIKRKFRSGVWRLKQAAIHGYYSTIKYVVEVITEKYWLIDYLPTFFKKKEHVLLIRLDLIGDFVLWLDSAKAYRHLYPDHKITLVVNQICQEVAETLPFWDNVLALDVRQLRTNYLYRLRAALKLRWQNFAVAIQPAFSRELVGDLLVRATHAPERIGYAGNTDNMPASVKITTDRWYTKLINNNEGQITELDINAHFMVSLGCQGFLTNFPSIPSNKMALRDNLLFQSPYIVIAPGASWSPKMWLAANFAKLISQLRIKFDVQIVICGGSTDETTCRTLAYLLGSSSVHDISGQTTLSELIEVIRHAQLVISNDSSPVHIAAAVSTPSVCILGGGHFGRFLPYPEGLSVSERLPVALSHKMNCFGCNWHCVYDLSQEQSVPCISSIEVSTVFDACARKLEQRVPILNLN